MEQASAPSAACEQASEEQWSADQQRAIDASLAGESVFITGGGGGGKTHVLRHIIEALRARNKHVRVTGSTGIAGTHISGSTLHAALGLGLCEEPLAALLERACRSTDLRARWRRADTLVIDEISMVAPEFLQKADSVVRVLRGECTRPFGGLQLVLCGDFLQLPPVRRGELKSGAAEFCFQLPLWREARLRVCTLEQVFRQHDARLVAALNRMRCGEPNADDMALFAARADAALPSDDGIVATCLHARCQSVEQINNDKLAQLPGDAQPYAHRTAWQLERSVAMSPRVEHAMQAAQRQLLGNCPAEPSLRLKRGAQVILVANIDFAASLVNGSRGVVLRFARESGDESATGARADEPLLPVVRFASGVERLLVPHRWSLSEPGVGTVSYYQVPLKLAWALTIHSNHLFLARLCCTDGRRVAGHEPGPRACVDARHFRARPGLRGAVAHPHARGPLD